MMFRPLLSTERLHHYAAIAVARLDDPDLRDRLVEEINSHEAVQIFDDDDGYVKIHVHDFKLCMIARHLAEVPVCLN